MTRVICLFACGLNFEDFKEARQQARNFRDYFSDVRDNLREECKDTGAQAKLCEEVN